MSSGTVAPASTLAGHVKIARHYQRSIRLDIDLGRADALEGYICHGTARAVLESMARQLLDSNQRAFTWTGPYGGGKSSLALSLASAIGRDRRLRQKARALLGLSNIPAFDQAMPVKRGGWLVVPVVGKRASVVAEIDRALGAALGLESLHQEREISATSVIEALCAAASDPGFDGVLLLLDEMGKFLEASANGGDDVYFFQELAEAAARTNGRLVAVGILHQSFRQYAARLGLDTRDDWAKVQGRYADIPLIAASDEVVELIGRAIDSDVKHPSTLRASKEVATSIRSRRASVGDNFGKSLDRCWPLHPTMAALLGPVSKRQFGQNERSTFGFLASAEPHGFQAFLNTNPVAETTWYCPEHYWDFLRANLEPMIMASSDGHRWAQAAEAVERTEARGEPLHISLIKNIAVIDLFRNGSGLVAESEVLYSLYPSGVTDAVDKALDDLSRWRIAVFRKHIGAWSVFEGSDFDIDAAVSQARGTLAELDLGVLTQLAGLHPIVAKRHYHRTGTLRWMGVSLCHLSNIGRYLEQYKPRGGEFGQFVLVLPDRQTTTATAISECRDLKTDHQFPVILGVPNNHRKIHDLGLELISLQLVQAQRPELEGDSVARREVVARIAYVRAGLEDALKAAFAEARWLVESKDVSQKVRLSPLASHLADGLYMHSPRMWSELVNRDSLSSNSVKARRDLLYRMLDHEGEENLGIEGYPAERGLYVTLLRSTGLHREDPETGAWRFLPPCEGPSEQFKKLWEATRALLDNGEQRVSVEDVYALWSRAPFGLRAGVHPILLLAFLLAHKDAIAVYKDGMFVPKLSDADIDECLQDKRRFSLHWMIIDQQRGNILNGIADILAEINDSSVVAEPLEAARGLVAMVFDLPQWTQRTRKLSPVARAIRDTLLKADDPHRVLFIDLPHILKAKKGADYTPGLREPLLELARVYDGMLQDIVQEMLKALDASIESLSLLRARAEVVAGVAGDLRQDAFATRLQSFDGQRESIEGILSLAANKPPRDWIDHDIDVALLEIAHWSLRFRQMETLVSVRDREATREAFAVVIGTGGANKTLCRTFDVPDRDRAAVKELAERIAQELSGSGHHLDLMLAALAEAGMSIVEFGQQGA